MASADTAVSLYILDKLCGADGDRGGPFVHLRASFRLQRLVDPTALCGLKLAEAAEPGRIANRIDIDDAAARGRRTGLRIAAMGALIRMGPSPARTMYRLM